MGVLWYVCHAFPIPASGASLMLLGADPSVIGRLSRHDWRGKSQWC